MAAASLCPIGNCNPITAVGSLLGKGATALGGDLLEEIAHGVETAVGKSLAALGTVWVKVPTPNLTGTQGHGPGAVQFLQGSLWWWTAAAAIAATIVGGVKLALTRRAQPGLDVVRGLVTLTVVNAAGVAVLSLAIGAADGFSGWVIGRATDGDFGRNLTALLGLSMATGTIFGPVLIIVLGGFALLASLVQVMLMIARGGMLVLLAGVLPLAAAMSSTAAGRVWLRRAIAWTVAFVLYKPAAAIVYATAFRLVGTSDGGAPAPGTAAMVADTTDATTAAGGAVPGQTSSSVVAVLTGLMMMLLALVALPALLRFLTPLVHATAGAGGHGAALLGAAPTGAMAIREMRRDKAGAATSSGSSGPARPDGAAGGGGGGLPVPRPGGAAPGGAAGATTAAGAATGPVGAAAGALGKASSAVRGIAGKATGGAGS